jgi:hypothetical protein
MLRLIRNLSKRLSEALDSELATTAGQGNWRKQYECTSG